MSITAISPRAAVTTPDAASGEQSQPSVGLGLAGAAVGGIGGFLLARRLGGGMPRQALIAGGLAIVGGLAAAFLGPRLIGGGDGTTPPGNGGPGSGTGRVVGTAYGRRTIDNGDGTSTWARVTAPLTLGAVSGARDGYSTLAEAVTATRPNTGQGELAYVRENATVKAYKLASSQLEAVEAYDATDSTVIAFTTRSRGDLLAGPAATDAERASNGLVTPPPPPF